jgi:hypothetical protein
MAASGGLHIVSQSPTHDGIPYYRHTNPLLVADKIRGVEAVLAEADR